MREIVPTQANPTPTLPNGKPPLGRGLGLGLSSRAPPIQPDSSGAVLALAFMPGSPARSPRQRTRRPSRRRRRQAINRLAKEQRPINGAWTRTIETRPSYPAGFIRRCLSPGIHARDRRPKKNFARLTAGGLSSYPIAQVKARESRDARCPEFPRVQRHGARQHRKPTYPLRSSG